MPNAPRKNPADADLLADAIAQRNAAERERDDFKKRLESCEAESKRAEKRRQAQKPPRKRSHG